MNSTPCVRDYMSRSLVTLTPDMRIQDAIEYLVEHEYSGAVVVDVSGKLAGMLSNKDCLKLAFEAGYHQDWPGTVGEYMSSPVETVDADLDVVAAAELFGKGHYRRYPVLEAGVLVGQISRYDILRALKEMW